RWDEGESRGGRVSSMGMASQGGTAPRSRDASRRWAPLRALSVKPGPLSWGATIPAGAGRARNTRGATEDRQGGLRPPYRKPPLPAAFWLVAGSQSHGPASRANPATLIN